MESKDTCYLQSQEGDKIQLQVCDGCPQLQELEALAMIARLEDRRMEELSNAALTTKDKLKMSAVAMDRSWDFYLMDYVLTGSFESGLRAVRDAPFLADLPGECLSELIPAKGLWSGWDIMKEIGYFTRAQRRKIVHSKRWVVHLFAGQEGHWQFMKLDQGDVTVLEFDLARCQGQDILRDETWRMLLWGAKEGKIDVIVGGPPARSQQQGKGGCRDTKSMTLVARMLWLHALSQVGREVNGTPRAKNRDVGFVLEYPEGPGREAHQAREALIAEREDELRDPEARREVASWDHSVWFWENIQQPRFELYTGGNTMDATNSFWETRMWKSYQREKALHLVSFDQGAMGGLSKNRTTIATNIHSLLSLDGLRVPEGCDLPESHPQDAIWSPGLLEALVVALSFWDRQPHCAPRIHAMSAEQWKRHVDSNHEVYQKECLTCVTSRGTGKQHRKVHHPESYVLTADVAGPLAKGLDPTSKGTMGKNLKYLLVAKYIVPKEYVALHSGRKPPENDGCISEAAPPVESVTDEQRQLLEELFGPDDSIEQAILVQETEVDLFPTPGPVGVVDVEEDLEMYQPSAEEEDDGEEGQEPEGPTADVVMSNGDCVAPELTFLSFGVGLLNNQSATVRKALQDIVLYLRMHGFPIYRFHADKGEFFNHGLRSWLADQGIYATWSEPGVPQGNGQAESLVRWMKDRTRTLLRSADLPMRLWPVAAATAATQQRAAVLGWRSLLAAPFGATVHLKRKAFDQDGPQRREQSLESKWMAGRYVGISTILHHGHLVYLPAAGEEREKFFHTAHVRPDLVDPGRPQDALREEVPKPRRRLTSKTDPEQVELRAITWSSKEAAEVAVREAKRILQNWSLEEAYDLVRDLARAAFFSDKKFGLYRHGGAVGWMKGIEEFPDLVRLMCGIVCEADPTATFTSMLVSCNALKPFHKDVNNDPRTYNYVVPIQAPSSGGELWVELKPGDCVQGSIEPRTQGEKNVYGQLISLECGERIKFGPRRAHEVCPWEGERIVLIAYSPQCLGKLTQGDVDLLHEYGFPIPLSQLPEFYENEEAESFVLKQVHLNPPEEESNNKEEPDWTMYLDLEPGLLRIDDSSATTTSKPVMGKTEVVYTRNIEKVLSSLSGPLDVTYTVDPQEVFGNLELWRPAIEKELKSIEIAIDRLPPGSETRKQWLSLPGVQRLPTKFVFTIKPNDKASQSEPETWYKRKARLVVCGNMAAEDGASVYTEAAPAEAVRAGLSLAVKNEWMVAVLDVVAAFLRTPMGRNKNDPVIVVQPPRLLESMSLVARMELWGLVRALYGLRQSPALWGDYRDHVLSSHEPPQGLRLQQGRAASSWWKVVDDQGHMVAMILVYVDDFLLCGPQLVVQSIAKWIQSIWDTSEPTFLAPGTSIRFLGMELHVEEQYPKEIGVGQLGYIQELMRIHKIPVNALDKIPISKELVAERDPTEPWKEDILRAQQLTGEILWLAQRSRPDLSYTTAIMASLCLKQPRQVIEIGVKALGYLQRTARFQLKIRWEENSLVMFCDAAYAPQSTRSHGGWLVMYGGSPIMWRSGKQPMITLSTAEAELLAIIDGAIAMKGVEALLVDMGIFVEEKQIASDSTSALSISTGSSSWRTRHLKIKAGWLQEQVAHGVFTTVHCPGERQPADLLTKALSSARTMSLLRLWGVGENVSQPITTTGVSVSSRALAAVICCLLMVSVRASEGATTGTRSIQLDWDMAGIFMLLLMALGALMIWEAIRWSLIEAYYEWTPGASKRKLKRLRKLQQATTAAIEQELERLQGDIRDSASGSMRMQTTTTSSSRSPVQDFATQRQEQQQPSSSSSSSQQVLPPQSGPQEQTSSSISRRRIYRTPSPSPRQPAVAVTPSWSPQENRGEPVSEMRRVCADSCSLMTCEALKEGLRTEGLPVSGVKDDLARRLGDRLTQLVSLPSGPTCRQLRYVLWLYRARDLGWKHSLKYYEINDRTRVSALIHLLKEL